MHRSFRKHVIAATLVAGGCLGFAQAQAQTQAAPGAPADTQAQQGRHVDPARRAERINRHLADLKQKLQITSAQEGAWNSFATAMQPPAPMQRPDRQAMAAMSTPERIDQMRAMRERHSAEMDRRAEATKAFYAQLSPEQKKTFDSETARMFQRGHQGGHGGHGGHGPDAGTR